jgi:hypothetical protein
MPQPDQEFETNSEVQIELAEIEKYINDHAVLAFPMIEWTAIATFDIDEDENITAVLQEESGIFYHLIISKENPNPLLERITEDDIDATADDEPDDESDDDTDEPGDEPDDEPDDEPE